VNYHIKSIADLILIFRHMTGHVSKDENNNKNKEK